MTTSSILQDKVALVTGGSRGIGRAVAKRLGAAGASVVVNYRSDESAAAEVVDAIERSGGNGIAVRADVSNTSDLRALFDAAEAHFGVLDIVVSNVGTARFAPLVDATDDDFDTIFATNARAGFVALREAARRLHDGGRIVAVSAGVTLTHSPGTGVYAASKAALEQLVRVLAREIGHRQITVNSVVPGAVRTDALMNGTTPDLRANTVARTPLGRLGEPGDIAEVVAFLASDAGRWITGQNIPASGGAF
jgi:3-oxoacyl-[acyl-carrier protein] reductase